MGSDEMTEPGTRGGVGWECDPREACGLDRMRMERGRKGGRRRVDAWGS